MNIYRWNVWQVIASRSQSTTSATTVWVKGGQGVTNYYPHRGGGSQCGNDDDNDEISIDAAQATAVAAHRTGINYDNYRRHSMQHRNRKTPRSSCTVFLSSGRGKFTPRIVPLQQLAISMCNVHTHTHMHKYAKGYFP